MAAQAPIASTEEGLGARAVHPFADPGLWRRVMPFAIVGLICIPIGAVINRPLIMAIGLVTAFVTVLGGLLLPWSRLPRWVELVPPLLWLVTVGFLRDGAAGQDTGYDLLSFLSIVWVAIYGSLRQVCVVVAMVGVVMLSPQVIVGGQEYPFDEWRQVVILLIMSAFTGVIIQRLVHQGRQQAAQLEAAHRGLTDRARDLTSMVDLARALDAAMSPRETRDAIARAVCDLTGAESALFFEPSGDEGVMNATSGIGIETTGDFTLDPRASVSGNVMRSGKAAFVPDLLADPRADHRLASLLDVRAAYFQPIRGPERPLGVLAAYWRTARPTLPDRDRQLIELFSVQAAVAIERADLNQRLTELARTDPLTGLVNRRALAEILDREIERARRGQRLSVVMLDLDRFKRFNDRFGHPVGDQLLEAAARAWCDVTRGGDVLGRYGGEEFLAILADCSRELATEVAERMRSVVPMGQTVSVGVASWSPDDDAASLVSRADKALYRAKEAGRNRVATDDQPIGTKATPVS